MNEMLERRDYKWKFTIKHSILSVWYGVVVAVWASGSDGGLRAMCGCYATTARHTFAIVNFIRLWNFIPSFLALTGFHIASGAWLPRECVYPESDFTHTAVSIYTIYLDLIGKNGSKWQWNNTVKKWNISFIFHSFSLFSIYFACFFTLSASKFVLLLSWRLSLDRTKCFLLIVKCVLLVSHMRWEHGKSIDGNHRIALHNVVAHIGQRETKRNPKGRETKTWNILHSFIHTTWLGWLATYWMTRTMNMHFA